LSSPRPTPSPPNFKRTKLSAASPASLPSSPSKSAPITISSYASSRKNGNNSPAPFKPQLNASNNKDETGHPTARPHEDLSWRHRRRRRPEPRYSRRHRLRTDGPQ